MDVTGGLDDHLKDILDMCGQQVTVVHSLPRGQLEYLSRKQVY
jgi:hypothetical protein